jgi:hypothetical protein
MASWRSGGLLDMVGCGGVSVQRIECPPISKICTGEGPRTQNLFITAGQRSNYQPSPHEAIHADMKSSTESPRRNNEEGALILAS